MGMKKLIFFFILIFIVIQLFRIIIPASITFSRYVYSVVRSYYLNSKEFYFNSDKLAAETSHFEADNWSGVDEYKITVNMNSRKNNLEYSETDIDYKIKYNVKVYHSDGTEYNNPNSLIQHTISKPVSSEPDVYEGHILRSANNKDYFDIIIQPQINVTFDDDDYVMVNVSAESISPYKQELKGEFKISIGNLGMSYKIEDQAYSPYLEVIVTNTLNYYIVDTPFGDYDVDATITTFEYNALSDSDKANCHSMTITLSFDPNYVIMDTTTNMYLVADSNGDTTNTIKNTYTYINSITFDMDAEESKIIKFYKVTASNDYTYPTSGSSTPIVQVSCS